MRLTARTLRRRKVGRQGHERFCLVGALALVAFLVVGWLTLAAYISLTAWPMSRQQHSTLDNHTPSLRQAFDSDPNPYFGWQPFTAQNMECSWRKCFKEEHQCTTCRDSSEDWGPAPPMSADWIPDVTLLHRMRLAGHDAQGRPWPPTLSDELCEQIGPVRLSLKCLEQALQLHCVSLFVFSPIASSAAPTIPTRSVGSQQFFVSCHICSHAYLTFDVWQQYSTRFLSYCIQMGTPRPDLRCCVWCIRWRQNTLRILEAFVRLGRVVVMVSLLFPPQVIPEFLPSV